MALRATLWLRARMTEQADIPATENKSPPPPHALRAPHTLWLVSQSPRATAAWSGHRIRPSPIWEDAGAPGATSLPVP